MINMKKQTIAILLLAAFAADAGAQTVADALRFSDNNYYGTARSISMGNAFTALGGDLGSISLNPAGSAVNNFSQATLTPNISIISSSAKYNAMPSIADMFGPATKNNTARFTMPNVGTIINMNTGNKIGLKSISFGIVANASANYLDDVAASGRNTSTTYAGYLAANASGVNSASINDNAYYDTDIPWQTIVGWKSMLISNYNSNNGDYIGVTEKATDMGSGNYDISLPDAIDQRYGRRSHGNKYDIVFNVGANISDRFFVGANLGVTSIDYSMNQYFKEFAVNPDSFQIDMADNAGNVQTTYFNQLRSRYSYDADGAGVYAKFGFIAVPVQGLRVGAAIQTPTANFITEHWQLAGETYYMSSNFDASAQSPRGEYKYKFVSPYRVNVGVAYTFGSLGVVSADYELCDYSTMKFSETETNDNSAFERVNGDIKNFAGAAHMLRLGAELKVLPSFAVRAGYNFSTSAERYLENDVKKTPKAYRTAISGGLGYSSKGSFFCDLAVRGTKFPYEYIYPYDTYIKDALSPEIQYRKRIWDVVMTFGWRF